MSDLLYNYLDHTVKMFEAMERVPTWRLYIALFFLGKEFINSLNKLAELNKTN